MKRILLLLLLPLGWSFTAEKPLHEWRLPYLVPAQEFDVAAEVGLKNVHETIDMPAFTIGEQITLGEYKDYLAMIQQESSESFYKTQLPDSSIGLPENYLQYMTDPRYEEFPAVGVSWDNALNYLRWRTILANKDTVCDTIYRLP